MGMGLDNFTISFEIKLWNTHGKNLCLSFSNFTYYRILNLFSLLFYLISRGEREYNTCDATDNEDYLRSKSLNLPSLYICILSETIMLRVEHRFVGVYDPIRGHQPSTLCTKVPVLSHIMGGRGTRENIFFFYLCSMLGWWNTSSLKNITTTCSYIANTMGADVLARASMAISHTMAFLIQIVISFNFNQMFIWGTEMKII